jgi:hypothetical protein
MHSEVHRAMRRRIGAAEIAAALLAMAAGAGGAGGGLAIGQAPGRTRAKREGEL